MERTENGHQVLAAGDTEVRFSPTLDQKDLETNAATQNGADARLKVCPLIPVGLRQVLAARTLRRDSPFKSSRLSALAPVGSTSSPEVDLLGGLAAGEHALHQEAATRVAHVAQ